MGRQTNPPAGGCQARGFRNQPFRMLRGRGAQASGTAPEPAPAAPATAAPSDAELFWREMEGVRPLAPSERSRVSPLTLRRAEMTPVNKDAEALAELSDLITGVGAFDLTDTSEYVEGRVVGLDPRLVRRLRAGEFSYQTHLDLHGMTSDDARVHVQRFLTYAHQRGYRCVLIIHGRGLNSEKQEPVLKKRVPMWLARGASSRVVLAFTSARACDGGAGALYVLLRRQRHGKRVIRVTEGSKL
jgi:DNA-nicking Smr family endonuclease